MGRRNCGSFCCPAPLATSGDLRRARLSCRSFSACASVCAEDCNCGSGSAGGGVRNCARNQSRPSPAIPASSPGRAPSPKRLTAMADVNDSRMPLIARQVAPGLTRGAGLVTGALRYTRGPLQDPRMTSSPDLVLGAGSTYAYRAFQAPPPLPTSPGNKDMAHLGDGSITLINTMNNTVLDRDAVKAKFDVYPEQIIDYLALVGDSSDNIPGIDKVGPKTAARLLQQYGGLDELIGHVAEVPGKVGENLRTGL